jgi:hypothetical protein
MAGRALDQERLVDPAKPGLVRHPGGRRGQVLHVDGLGEEVFGAELHRANRGGDVGLAGEEDDGGVALAEVLQHLHAVHPGEPEVEDHHLRAQAVEGGQPGLAAQLASDLVADPLEVVADAAQHVNVVVD